VVIGNVGGVGAGVVGAGVVGAGVVGSGVVGAGVVGAGVVGGAVVGQSQLAILTCPLVCGKTLFLSPSPVPKNAQFKYLSLALAPV